MSYEGFKQHGDALPQKGKSAEEIGYEAGLAVRNTAKEAGRVWKQEFVEPMGEFRKRVKVHARLTRRKVNSSRKEVHARLSEGARKTKEALRPIVTGEKTQEFTETLTPASLPLILRGIDKRFIDVHDTYHGKPAYFLKLEQALDEMYYAYADAGDAPSLGATGSKLLAKTAMFLESTDMDDEAKAKQYREASARALHEVIGKRMQDEMRRDLTGYLTGSVHTLNSGETVRSEPNYRMLSNMLVFLDHWNERQIEVTDRQTDPLLSEPRIRELFEQTLEHVRHEIVLIHSMVEEESKREQGDTVPPSNDEHVERLRKASLTEKWGRIFELQRIADELTHLSPDTYTTHPNKLRISEDGLYREVLVGIAGSFAIDTHFGSKMSETFEKHFERNQDDEILVTNRLHEILSNECFAALEHIPVAELVSYCNEIAKSGMLDVVTNGEYRDARGKKNAYTFDERLLVRIRAYLKTHGGEATGELTRKFSSEARRVLGIDRMLFHIRDEIPFDSSTPSGFIPYAETLLQRIPKESPERAKFFEQHRDVLRDIFTGLWETGGVKDIADFGESLITRGVVERDVLPELVFGKNGFLPRFGKDFGNRITTTATLDMRSALVEINASRASGFDEFISPSLIKELRRILRTKLTIALSEHGSADTLSFLDELKSSLVGPYGIISEETFEGLREDVLYDDPAWLERRLP